MSTSSRNYTLPAFLIIAILTSLSFVWVRHVNSAQQNFTLESPRLQGDKIKMKVGEPEVDITIRITDPALGTDIRQVNYTPSNDYLEITPTETGVKLKALKS